MNVIVCVDDSLGMLFHNRRQSRDRVLNAYLLKLTAGPLHIGPFSQKLFRDAPEVLVSEAFLAEAGDGDWCFAEDQSLLPWESKIERLVLCRWNRAYPADRYLDLDLQHWVCVHTEEFPGSSHEKITVETYRKQGEGNL